VNEPFGGRIVFYPNDTAASLVVERVLIGRRRGKKYIETGNYITSYDHVFYLSRGHNIYFKISYLFV
jgi:hypothetical protein